MRALAIALAAALAAGCGGVEGDLLEALRAEEEQALCVGTQVLGVDVYRPNDGKLYLGKPGAFSMFGGGGVDALPALKAEGFVGAEPAMMPMGFGTPVEAFELTAKGAEFFRENAFSGSIEVCLGEKRAVEILEYTEPPDAGMPVVQARFRYELALNDLADELGLEDEIREELEREYPGEGLATFTKTNKGWRLELAMWR